MSPLKTKSGLNNFRKLKSSEPLALSYLVFCLSKSPSYIKLLIDLLQNAYEFITSPVPQLLSETLM